MEMNEAVVAPTNEPVASIQKPCSECGVLGLGSFYRKQIRRLHEKLEYSELKRRNLSSECKQLRKELREAEFRGRSSVSPTPCPTLPNEVLHQIFSFATHLEGGLVSPHWRVEEPYAPWVISLKSRLSIPLVCRQWHCVGLQYLYQHIVIFRDPQLTKLLQMIQSFTRIKDLLTERTSWIRGLELILLEEGHRDGISSGFARGARELIAKIHPGRLQLFGVENVECTNSSSWRIIELVADGLNKSEGSLESLHLPCILGTSHGWKPRYESRNGHFELGAVGSTALLNLQILSLTSGRWESCEGRRRNYQEIIPFLTFNVHSIHTIHLNWLYEDYSAVYLAFFQAAVNLQIIHVVIGRRSSMADLDGLLHSLPQLRRLVITPSNRHATDPVVLQTNDVSHKSLEEVVLVMDSSSAYKSIFIINPLFSKIQSGHLPGLKQVVVRGPYPGGCLDGRGVFPAKCAQSWMDAINACAGQKVDLIDEEGSSVHLWGIRHGLRCDVQEEQEDSERDFSSFDEGEWWEVSSSEFSGTSVREDDIVSNDSEDSPYRYVSHPDLEYDSDSEEL